MRRGRVLDRCRRRYLASGRRECRKDLAAFGRRPAEILCGDPSRHLHASGRRRPRESGLHGPGGRTDSSGVYRPRRPAFRCTAARRPGRRARGVACWSERRLPDGWLVRGGRAPDRADRCNRRRVGPLERPIGRADRGRGRAGRSLRLCARGGSERAQGRGRSAKVTASLGWWHRHRARHCLGAAEPLLHLPRRRKWPGDGG